MREPLGLRGTASRLIGPVSLSLLLLVGCAATAPPTDPAAPDRPATAQPVSPQVAAQGLVDESYRGPFLAAATVREQNDEGPQLCIGAVALSDPPVCGGPPIANWSWDAVPHESRAGVRYGSYAVEGSFHGTTFTLTAPAETFNGQAMPGAGNDVDLTPQCPEPEGGWQPTDGSRATEARLREALQLAPTLNGYAGAWINEGAGANARDTLVNVRTTSDVAAAEQALREVWGGALCVSLAERSYADLRRIQADLTQMPGVLGIGIDVPAGQVDLQVVVATSQEQARLDHQYGPAVVRLQGELRPPAGVGG